MCAFVSVSEREYVCVCLTSHFFFSYRRMTKDSTGWLKNTEKLMIDAKDKKETSVVLFFVFFFCTIKVILTELIVPVCCIIKQTVY